MERERSEDHSIDTCHPLTDAERPILGLVGKGLTDQVIAIRLGETLVAVQSSIRRFRDKTGLGGRALVAWASRHEQCCIDLPSGVRQTFALGEYLARRDHSPSS